MNTNDRHDDEIVEFHNDKDGAYIKPVKIHRSKKGIWAVLGGLLLVLAKFKTVLLLVLGKLKFLFVFLKLGKVMTTFGSMLLMIVVYTRFYGWVYGVGFVVLLLIHETGHYVAAKQVNLKVSAPVFIPFMGAFIALKENPSDAVTEAKVAIGGPMLGSTAAFLCVAVYLAAGNHLYLALAYSGFFINLLNLIPVHPLDGGRIVAAISPKLWLIGIPVMLVVALKFFNPILILFLILGGIQAYKHWKSPNHEYYNTPFGVKLVFALLYFGLMSVLGAGMASIHNLHADMNSWY